MARRLCIAAALAMTGCSSPSADPPPTASTSTTSTTLPPVTTRPTVPPAVVTSSVRATAPPATEPTGPPPGPAGAGGAVSTARASWYARGARTASGEAFDADALTFAHRSLAFGTTVRFCVGERCAVGRCTDRGPAAWTGRDFDLSRALFAELAPLGAGVVTVTWEAA